MENNERYSRHYLLKGFGKEAQQKLLSARVLVIGAGGLGCPVLQYLTAAGVGTLGIVDHDVVSLNNLQRQVLYNTEDVGQVKALVATRRLTQLNPEIRILPFQHYLTVANAPDLVSQFDMVVDCTDNFPTRYLLNDVCVLLNKPLIFGAIFRYEGQVSVFNVPTAAGHQVNYRHLFPTPPGPLEVPDCNQSGVLGVLPGTIGMIQATEVIKLISGVGEVLAGKLLTMNLLDHRSYLIDIQEEGLVDVPQTLDDLKAMDYKAFCQITNGSGRQLTPVQFQQKRKEADTLVIDVRDEDEVPALDFAHLNIPLLSLRGRANEIEEHNIILLCLSGKRSSIAAEILTDIFGNSREIWELAGGIRELTIQEENE